MWSLGMTVLHCATGHKPWSHVKTAYGHDAPEPQLVLHISDPDNKHPITDELAPWLSNLIRCCIARDPSQRLSCEQFIAAVPVFDDEAVQNIW